MQANFHAFQPNETEIEREFSLVSDAEWSRFFGFPERENSSSARHEARTTLFRQVHPDFIPDGQLTSQAFMPFPKDAGKLSVYDGDQISAAESCKHYTEVLRNASDSVWGVTCAEVAETGLISAPAPLEIFRLTP